MRRNPIPYRPVEERMGDWQEVVAQLPREERGDLLNTQSARCMNCGTPFCHQTSSGVRSLVHPPSVSLSGWLHHRESLCLHWLDQGLNLLKPCSVSWLGASRA